MTNFEISIFHKMPVAAGSAAAAAAAAKNFGTAVEITKLLFDRIFILFCKNMANTVFQNNTVPLATVTGTTDQTKCY